MELLELDSYPSEEPQPQSVSKLDLGLQLRLTVSKLALVPLRCSAESLDLTGVIRNGLSLSYRQ